MAELLKWVNSVFLVIDAVALLIIFLLLLHYRPSGATYRREMSILAFLMMVCCVWGFTFIVTGVKNHATIPESIIYIIFMVAVWRARGNVAQLHGPLTKKAKNDRTEMAHGSPPVHRRKGN
ncbi:TPA: phage holin family protein [Enterobacter kobei]|nr:phage holin family protein [Enterobacter kobei]